MPAQAAANQTVSAEGVAISHKADIGRKRIGSTSAPNFGIRTRRNGLT